MNLSFSQNVIINYIGQSDEKITLSYNRIGSTIETVSLSKKYRSLKIKSDDIVIIESCDKTRKTKIFAQSNDTIDFFIDKRGLLSYSCKNNSIRKTESEYLNYSFLKYGPILSDFEKELFAMLTKKVITLNSINQELDYLELNYKNKQISKNFYEYLKDVYFSLEITNQLTNDSLFDKTSIQIKKSFENGDVLIKIPEYQNMLSDFLTLTLKKNYVDRNHLETMKLIVNEYSNQSIIDYLLFEEAKKNLKERYNSDSFNFFFKNCKDEIYLNEIKEELSPVLSSVFLSEIIKKNKGKIILVDFWASWCLPCIQEFPYEEELMQTYSEVYFVFISIDKSKSSWVNASNRYLNILNKNNNFWLDKNSDDELMKIINVSTIPRYVLFGKNGEIININAPRPSSLEIHKLIQTNIDN